MESVREKAQQKDKKEIVNGEIVKVRRGLPRTNLPVDLPANSTWLKQSNFITLMAGDLSTLQLRTLILIVEKLQGAIEQSIQFYEKFGYGCVEQLSLFQDVSSDISIKIAYKDLGIAPEHYPLVREVVRKMVSTPVEFPTINPETGEAQWTITGLITKANIPRKADYSRTFTVKIDQDVARVFVNMDRGFTRYIKEIAFGAQSKYTIRMYMLVSSWREKGGFSITLDKLRKFLGLEKKYSRFKDLYKRVIRPVYEDLFEKADCWFEVAEIYREKTDTEPYKLNFKVIRSALNKREIALLEAQKKMIDSICRLHFSMDANHMQQLLPLINLTNYQRVLQKIQFLSDYVRDNIKRIKSVPEYCFQSLIDEAEAHNGTCGENIPD